MLKNIISWNIAAGLKSNRNGILAAISETQAQIVCLQETRLRQGFELHEKYFNTYYTPQTDNTLAGGALIAVSIGIPSREVFKDLHKNIATVEIFEEHRKVTIISVYLPNDEWNSTFNKLEEVIKNTEGKIILTGDLNAKHSEWFETRTNTRGNRIVQLSDEFNLTIIDRNKPTHYNKRNKTHHHIDVTMVSSDFADQFIWDTEDSLYGSDHYPVKITDLEANGTEMTRKSLKYHYADWKKFSEVVETEIANETKCDTELFEIEMQRRFHVATEKYIPCDTITYKKPPKYWWNNECKQAKQKVKQIENRRKRRPWDVRIIREKEAAEYEYTEIINKAKEDSWKCFTEQLQIGTPASIMWKKIKEFRGKYKQPNLKPIHEDNKEYKTQKEIVKYLEGKFKKTSAVSNTSQEFQTYKEQYDSEQQETTEEETDYNNEFNLEEVRESLASCAPTASGWDNITYQMLKNLTDNALKVVLKQMNSIWIKGEIPIAWKTAMINPIPKPGKNIQDCRPISLLPTRSRLMDRIINRRLVHAIEQANGFPMEQSAFRKGRGTIDNLLTIEGRIRKSLAEKKITTVLFLDIEKAFDSVYQKIILKELTRIGIKGRIWRYIKNFMEERRAFVKVYDQKSDIFPLELGVPQGSSLSTTLFSIAMHTIVNKIKTGEEGVECSLYVDDVTLYTTSESIKENNTKLNRVLKKISDWSNQTNLRISLDKTKVMHFHRLRKRNATVSDVPVKFKGRRIEEVNQYKYLGIIFDKTLNWTKHVDYITGKARRAMNTIKTLANKNFGTDAIILKRIYLAIVRPIMEYGGPLIMNMSKTNLNKLQVIQNEAMRIILGAHRSTPISYLEVETDLMNMRTRFQQLTAQYYARTSTRKNHPMEKLMQDVIPNIEGRKNTHGNIASRVIEIIGQYNLPPEKIEPTAELENPSWTINKIKVCEKMMKKEKDDNNILTKTYFTEHLSAHSGEHIYTDGSVKDGKIGAAFTHIRHNGQLHKEKFKIVGTGSAFIAETVAILQALRYIYKKKFVRSTIFTDSKSAILALNNQYSTESENIQSKNVIDQIIEEGREIEICWSPGHCMIQGNEITDQAAKEAGECGEEYKRGNTYASFKMKLKDEIKNYRQNQWQLRGPSWYRKFKEKVGPLKIIDTNRRKDVILRRLKLGYTKSTHDYHFKKEEPPDCECWNPLNVFHWIYVCHFNRNPLRSNPRNKDIFEKPDLKELMFEYGRILEAT